MKKLLLSLVAMLGFTTAFAGTETDVKLLVDNDTDWTYEITNNPDALEYVWSYSTQYGIKASAYVNKVNHEAEAYAISPVVDLTTATAPTMVFDHALNFLDSAPLASHCNVYARVAGSTEWTAVTVPTWPDGKSWTFVNSGSVDLNAFKGQKIQLGFKYNSTAAVGPTWEIKNLTISLDATDAPVDPVEPTVETVDNISGFIAKASDAKPVVAINNTVTAVYQNGSYLYVKDATGWLLVYGKPAQYNNGDVIPAGITGTAALYNGAAQLSSPVAETFKEATSGAAVEPTTVLCEEISADMIHQYVLLKGVTIAAGSGRSYTMTDASEVSVTLYQQFNDATKYDEVVTIPTGENYNVYGFVGLFNGTAQVLATKIVSATGKEIVATPSFSVAAGEVTEGTSVEITCATEGASIYYTLDGSEPTTASTLYTAAIVINEAKTIKAIAVKDGMDNSSVATAEYTIKAPFVPADNAAYFVAPQFTEVEGTKLINNDGSEKMADGNNDMKDETKSLVGKTFENNGVSLVFTHGDGQSYTIANGNQVRWYKGEIATITAPEGAAITKVFVQTVANSKGSFTANVGTVEGKGTGATTPITWTGNTTEPLVLTTEAQVRLSYIEVTFETETGIEDVEINNNAPVEYFNLQGVRVEEPTSGLYIRRQGNNVSKVVIR